jgi:hypothetical protein
MQHEWMAVDLSDLSVPEIAGRLGGTGSGRMTVFEALGILESSDEAGFHRVLAAFFEHKRLVAGPATEGGLP